MNVHDSHLYVCTNVNDIFLYNDFCTCIIYVQRAQSNLSALRLNSLKY